MEKKKDNLVFKPLSSLPGVSHASVTPIPHDPALASVRPPEHFLQRTFPAKAASAQTFSFREKSIRFV